MATGLEIIDNSTFKLTKLKLRESKMTRKRLVSKCIGLLNYHLSKKLKLIRKM
jgi:hypothetical protein